MELIDFTDLAKTPKTYGGANGKKLSAVLDGQRYMLKFPPPAKTNRDMSYSNGCFGEYIGCRIYETTGIPVQETLLGKYTTPAGTEKIVVACKDFTAPGIILQDFAQLRNTIVDLDSSGYGTELSDIQDTFRQQAAMDQGELQERFWDMFIVDAFIGNWDRHNGNWGFLYNELRESVELAPVFDCGSSLYPQADNVIMAKTLCQENEMNLRIYEVPTSAIKVNGKKVRYFDFISSLENTQCNAALERIVPRINMNEVNAIIEETPALSDLQRDFYETVLAERKSRILDFSLHRLRENERQTEQDIAKKRTIKQMER